MSERQTEAGRHLYVDVRIRIQVELVAETVAIPLAGVDDDLQHVLWHRRVS